MKLSAQDDFSDQVKVSQLTEKGMARLFATA